MYRSRRESRDWRESLVTQRKLVMSELGILSNESVRSSVEQSREVASLLIGSRRDVLSAAQANFDCSVV